MTRVITTQESKLLVPNEEHKNFTATGNSVPTGTTLKGNSIVINGLRRGSPFQYRLFKLENTNQYIYSNNIKNVSEMETTDISLGADANVSPTRVDIPSTKKKDKTPLMGAVIGAGVGFGYARYKKMSTKKQLMFIGVGALAGYVTGRMIAKKDNVTVKVKPSV
jgi:hypothetical protein